MDKVQIMGINENPARATRTELARRTAPAFLATLSDMVAFGRQ
jgi:hypothetical protein